MRPGPPHRPVLVLWILLLLFCVRVLGQLVVFLGWAPFLPPLHEWHSELLPYGLLLAAQMVIIVLYSKACLDLTRDRGALSMPRPGLGRRLWIFGWLYLVAMVLRYVIRMSLYPEARWTGGAIPIVFHWVLATFLLVLAAYHRRPPTAPFTRGPIARG